MINQLSEVIYSASGIKNYKKLEMYLHKKNYQKLN